RGGFGSDVQAKLGIKKENTTTPTCRCSNSSKRCAVCGNCVALHCICTGEGGASSRKRPGEGLSETPIPLKAMKTEEGGPVAYRGISSTTGLQTETGGSIPAPRIPGISYTSMGEVKCGCHQRRCMKCQQCITRHCQCADPTPYPQTAKTRKTVKTPATPSDQAGGPIVCPAVASILSATSTPPPFQNPPPAEVPSVPNVVALAAAAAVAKVAAAQNLSETTSKRAAASSAAPSGNDVTAKSAGASARRTTRRSAARPLEAASGQTESGAAEKEVVEVKQEPMVLTRRRTRSMSKDMEQMKKMTAATSVKDDSSSSASTSSAKQRSSSASATGHKYGDYRTVSLSVGQWCEMVPQSVTE
ncbi:hypothetical protein FOZ62_028794, partial [Perkinsus olseni]